MTTYVYETIPAKSDEKPRYVELRQSMKDAPLTRHPETGERIRRVVTGGYGLLSTSKAGGSSAEAGEGGGGGGCCQGRCGCHH